MWRVFFAGFGLACSIAAIPVASGVVRIESGRGPVPLRADGTAAYSPRDLLCLAATDRDTAKQTVWDGDGHEMLTRELPLDAPLSAVFDY